MENRRTKRMKCGNKWKTDGIRCVEKELGERERQQ